MPIPSSMSPKQYLRTLADVLQATAVTGADGSGIDLDGAVADCVGQLVAARNASRTVFCVGNGGSAAIASHVCNDLIKMVHVRAQSLNDVAVVTAFSNDEGYENVYSMPLQLMASAGDLLFAVSSSGRSKNILQASAVVRERGGRVVTFSGFDPANPLRNVGNVNFYIPSTEYGFVELAHASLLHCITDLAAVHAGSNKIASR